MELSTLIACLFALSSVLFCAGVAVGCTLSLYLTAAYKRNAALAYQEGVERARLEHLNRLSGDAAKAKRYEENPLNAHKEERERSVEESLANIYPDDPAMQAALKEERKQRKLLDQP